MNGNRELKTKLGQKQYDEYITHISEEWVSDETTIRTIELINIDSASKKYHESYPISTDINEPISTVIADHVSYTYECILIQLEDDKQYYLGANQVGVDTAYAVSMPIICDSELPAPDSLLEDNETKNTGDTLPDAIQWLVKRSDVYRDELGQYIHGSGKFSSTIPAHMGKNIFT